MSLTRLPPLEKELFAETSSSYAIIEETLDLSFSSVEINFKPKPLLLGFTFSRQAFMFIENLLIEELGIDIKPALWLSDLSKDSSEDSLLSLDDSKRYLDFSGSLNFRVCLSLKNCNLFFLVDLTMFLFLDCKMEKSAFFKTFSSFG